MTPRPDGLPTHAPPAGPGCACRFCYLWGYMGPIPAGVPTARNPAPRPVAVEPTGAGADVRGPTLFDEVPHTKETFS